MLTVGSDPEFFLRDSKGNLVPSFGLLGGTKESPIKTPHGFIQEDNVTAEVNSLPAVNLEEFLHNHRLVLQDLEDIIKPLNLSVDIKGSALFTPELLSHPLAYIAGCEPDYDAWALTQNMPASYQGNLLRAAGGHLHIGFDEAKVDMMSRIAFCKALDLELGLPSVILDPDQERRSLYGKAGSHRPKLTQTHPDVNGNTVTDDYDGIEYRVLSNFWMASESLQRFVYNKIKLVDENLRELSDKAESIKDELVDVINNGAPEDAIVLCNSMGVSYAH